MDKHLTKQYLPGTPDERKMGFRNLDLISYSLSKEKKNKACQNYTILSIFAVFQSSNGEIKWK